MAAKLGPALARVRTSLRDEVGHAPPGGAESAAARVATGAGRGVHGGSSDALRTQLRVAVAACTEVAEQCGSEGPVPLQHGAAVERAKAGQGVARTRGAVMSHALRRASSDLASFLALLLREGGAIDTWRAVLGPRDRAQLLDPLFAQPWLCLEDLLPVLCATLRSSATRGGAAADGGPRGARQRGRHAVAATPGRVQEAAHQLAEVVRGGAVAGAVARACAGAGDGPAASAAGAGSAGTAWAAFVAQLCCVPTLAANALKRHAPDVLYPRHYFPALVRVALDAVPHAAGGTAAPVQLAPPLAALVQRLVREGQTEALCAEWLARAHQAVAGSRTGTSGWPARLNLALLRAVPPARVARVAGALCHQLGQAAPMPPRAVVGAVTWALFVGREPPVAAAGGTATPALAFEPGTELHTVWCHVLCVRVLPRRVVRALVATAVAALPHGEMVKALQHAVRLWSSAMFVSNGNLPLQQSVTRAILMALPSVSAEELQGGAGGSTLLQTLLAGVQVRPPSRCGILGCQGGVGAAIRAACALALPDCADTVCRAVCRAARCSCASQGQTPGIAAWARRLRRPSLAWCLQTRRWTLETNHPTQGAIGRRSLRSWGACT